MPSYRVRYFERGSASVREERVEAVSKTAVRESWSSSGRVVLDLRTDGIGSTRFSERSSAFDVAGWCRELGTLLAAGMTVVEAIETLHAQSREGAQRAVQAILLRALREGQSLSRAMLTSNEFPKVLVASITASERTSTLVRALEDYLRYDEMIQRLRRQIVSAAIYPAVVVAFGALVALFLLLYVIPRFSRMYVDFHGALSVPTRVLLAVSSFLHDDSLVVIGLLTALVGIVLWAWKRGHFRSVAIAFVEKVGPLRLQWDHFRRAKLYQSLALMFRGGFTLDEALSVCEGMGLGQRMDHAIGIARTELARGRSVVTSFGEAHLADSVGERLLAVGERSGSFESVLQTIADRHAAAFATFVERATRIVEPLLLLIVALVVGGIVLMMYMPIFDIANGVR